MASLALGIVGSAFGPIGGFIGSAIGSMIDNAIFPQKQEGPRLTDLSVQVSSYGNPIPLIFGPENRLAGSVIWTSGLIETATKTSAGGKGGPSVQVTNYTYRASVAVLLGDRHGLGPIKGLKKIFANSKVIYDADQISSVGVGVPQGVSFGVFPLLFRQLTQVTQAVFSSITVYPGDFNQDPDPTIEAHEGAGNVPAYRGSAYVVIADLQLADFGNRIPNLEFLCVADDEISTGAIACEICDRCGLDSMTVSTAFLRDPVRGYKIGSNSSGVGAIQPLALAFDFDAADVAGGLRFTPRTSSPVLIIPANDLGGHAYGDSRPLTMQWSRSQETALPRESAVTFIDSDRDYQLNTATARRSEGSADSNLSNQLPLTVSVDEAQKIADRTLWEAWQSRQTASAQTTDRWAIIEAGKKYLFETPAGLEPLRVTRRTRGANGVIDLDLKRDRIEVYRSTKPGVAAAIPSNALKLPGVTELVLLDIPILLDGDDNPGFYFAVVGSTDGWRGADVLRALSISADYSEVAPVGISSKVGDVVGTVPNGTIPDDDASAIEFDEITVIRVELRNAATATLESVDDDALDGGANACFIGDPNDTTQGEILQFGVATMVVAGTYDLSHLIRGRKGTEFAVPLHGANEMFVLLTTSDTKRANYGVSDLGLERAFKGVSLLTSETDADAVLFTNTGVGLRPYSPIALEIVGTTGTDLDLQWTRRSRREDGALGTDDDSYTVRIMNALGTVIVREAVAVGPSFEYTTAMQTTDFGGAVSDLRWRVAQISSVYGNGIFAESIGPVPA